MSKLHELKFYPDFFNAIKTESKSFEVRKNDSNFAEGDRIILKEFDPVIGFTGNTQERMITHVSDFEPKEGYVGFEMETLI